MVKIKPKVWKHAMKPSDGSDAEQDDAGRHHRRHRDRRADPRHHLGGQDRHRGDRTRTGVYDAWFIFFAPADHPVVAGAVVIEHSVGGFGGAVAAPIAKQLVQAILPAASK